MEDDMEPDTEADPFREEPRYADTAARVYATDRIEVTWEPSLCIHAAECIRGAPAVFDPQRRPWIVPENVSPDRIGDVISRCPTGALHFRRLDGGPAELVSETTTATALPNGP